jgi:hypothetical protein
MRGKAVAGRWVVVAGVLVFTLVSASSSSSSSSSPSSRSSPPPNPESAAARKPPPPVDFAAEPSGFDRRLPPSAEEPTGTQPGVPISDPLLHLACGVTE